MKIGNRRHLYSYISCLKVLYSYLYIFEIIDERASYPNPNSFDMYIHMCVS